MRSVFIICVMTVLCGAASFLEGLSVSLGLARPRLRALRDSGDKFAGRLFALSSRSGLIAILLRVLWLLAAVSLFGYTADAYESNAAAITVFSLAALVTVAGLAASKTRRLSGVFTPEAAPGATEREIKLLIDEDGGGDSEIDEVEKEMIRNIFEFDNTTANDVAVHRKDVVMISVSAGRDEIIETALKERFSRIPVYEDNIDNIIGVLHIKDLFRQIHESGGGIDLRAVIRKPFFVPMTKKTDELFQEMRGSKAHMAIVVDEYGGTAGLVTMENLIEEIMGSIYDEDDEEEIPQMTHVYGEVYAVDGKAPLELLSEVFSAEPPAGGYDTVSGFIIGRLGRIPAPHERPAFVEGRTLFKIFSMEENRVGTAVVARLENDERRAAEKL